MTHNIYYQCGVTLGFGVSVGLCGAGLSLLSRGFSGSPTCSRRCSVLYSGTLSARDVGPRSTLHGFAYCNSSRERRVGSPAGQYLGLSSLIRPRQSSPGTARLVSHRLVSAEPRALAATRPLGHSLVFPHVRRKACLSR